MGAIFVLAIAITVALVKTRSPTYKATAQVLVTPVSSSNTAYSGLPVVNDASSDPTLTVQTAATLLETRAAAAAAARILGPTWTVPRVLSGISVLQQGETDVVSVTGSAEHAGNAARLANAYVRGSLSTRTATLAADAGTLIRELQAQQRSLPASDTTNASAIAAQIATLQSVASGNDPNFSLLAPASVPTSQSGTSPKLLALLGALAGLVVGIGVATLLEHLNRHVRDEDEILSICPLPVLVRVPELPSARPTTSLELMAPRIREVYRTLQVQLPPHRDDRARTIMLTSASSGDGKTTGAVNLALVLAAAGFDVVLADFDLRKADIGRQFPDHADFVDYFRANAELSTLLKPVRGVPGLRVVTTSPRGDVTALLEAVSRRMPEMLRDLSTKADYIVIDTAPLGHVSDALRMMPLVDDVILVVRPGHTDRTELRRSQALMDRMGHQPTGIVVVGDPGRRGHESGYGYGYTTDAPSDSTRTMDRGAPGMGPADPPTVERGR